MPSSKPSSKSVKFEISAGGVIYRRAASGIEVGLIATQAGKRWQLPKGLVEKGETLEVAAAREVKEETGLSGEVKERVDKIDYWFVWRESDGQPVRHHKLVYFFLLEYQSGDTARHDQEVHEARWFPIDRAIRELAFANERRVLEKAKRRLDITYGSGG